MPPCCSAISASPVYQRKATKQKLWISSDETTTTTKKNFSLSLTFLMGKFLYVEFQRAEKTSWQNNNPKKISILRQSGCMMRHCSPWGLAVPSSTAVSEYTMWHSARNILFGCVCQNKLFLCFIPDLFVSQHPWEQTTKEALIRYSLYSWNELCN